ncbi:MAG: hypothetical protein ACP6IP_10975, partial [Candidatus Njordarchaeia archaeon]
ESSRKRDNKSWQLIKIALSSLVSVIPITIISVKLSIEPSLDMLVLGGLGVAAIGTFLIGYFLAEYRYNIDPVQREKAKAMREIRRLLNLTTDLRIKSSFSLDGVPNPFDNLLLAVLKKIRDLALQAGNRELAETYEKEIAKVEKKLNRSYVLETIGIDIKKLSSEISEKESIDSKQVNLVYEVIKQLVRENSAADLESIIRRTYKISKMNDIMVLQALDKLISDGFIYETTKGVYKIVEDVDTNNIQK